MRLFIYPCVLTLSAVIPVTALGADEKSWHCRNTDFEISCDGGKCVNSDAHTPMNIHVGTQEISWCAYASCWTGQPGSTVTSGRFVSFFGSGLQSNGDAEKSVDVAIVIDTNTGAASVLAADYFATPTTCKLEE